MEQNNPIKNNNTPIVGLVMKDLTDRLVKGTETYGVPLQAGNGRDAMQDLYEELLDACCYIKQVMVERDTLINLKGVQQRTEPLKFGEVNALYYAGTTGKA